MNNPTDKDVEVALSACLVDQACERGDYDEAERLIRRHYRRYCKPVSEWPLGRLEAWVEDGA